MNKRESLAFLLKMGGGGPRRSWLLLALVVAQVVACGGGGTAPESEEARSAAQTIAVATGGQVDLMLADGGSAALEVAPGTFAKDTAVTLRSLPADPTSPVRLEITPSIERFAQPATLRVRLPASVDAARAPVLRWHGGGWIATRLLADGRLEATIGPPAGASPGARGAASGKTRSAGADLEPPSQIDVNPFMVICEQPADAVTAARGVFERDTNPEHIRQALATLVNLRNNCGQVASARQAVLAMQGVVAEQLPAAERAWRDIDHRDLAQLPGFHAGLTRLLAWCAAGLQMGMDVRCPDSETLAIEMAEVLEGFSIAVGLADDLAVLQRQGADLVRLAATAQMLGIPGGAGQDLLALAGRVGTRIVDRAYALCSMIDLLPWADVDAALPGAYDADLVRDAMLYCGTGVRASARDSAGNDIASAALALQGGDAQGNGAVGGASMTVPTEGSVVMRFTGPAMRCTRVIGSPAGADEIVWRVGAVELARRPHDGNRFNGPDVVLSMPALRRTLGQAADSREPITVEIWRVTVSMDCELDDGPRRVTWADTRLYSLMLLPPTAALAITPSAASVPMFGSRTFEAIATGLPDGAVDWSASAGTIDAGGRFTAPATPGSYTVTATSRTQPSLKAQATVTVAMPVSARLMLSVDAGNASTTSGTDWRMNNIHQQRVLISNIQETWSRTAKFAAGPVSTNAAPTLDVAGNLVFAWEAELPAAIQGVRWGETFSFRRTEVTLCGPQYRDTVTLVSSLTYSGNQFVALRIGARLTITPGGIATLSLAAQGHGPAQGADANQWCLDDPVFDQGVVGDGPTGAPLGTVLREQGTYRFDWMKPGRETTPISAPNSEGTRELAWNSGSGYEKRDIVERTSKVNADPATALQTVGRTVMVIGWTIELQ